VTDLALSHRALPNVASATLPASYERARTALATCTQIDECKDWADKAAALASYAKQADDDSLQKFALRIQARAIRRCGELLKTFQNPGARTDQPTVGTDERLTQRQAAAGAGMSERQELTAVRVANVPVEDFEAAIESDDPPTVTRLAEAGTASRPTEPQPFILATRLIGTVTEFADFCATHPPERIAHGVYTYEMVKLRAHVSVITTWLDSLLLHLEHGGQT
jgi:hypothetical protein